MQIKLDEKLSEEGFISRGVRQGCPLSPTLFAIYINEIICCWNKKYPLGITISGNTKLNTLLFADDQIIISNSEDNLQKAVFALQKVAQEYGMQISLQKTKVMAFRGVDPVRSKIVLDNVILEQVNNFMYLGCNI